MAFLFLWVAFPFLWFFQLTFSQISVKKVSIPSIVFWGLLFYQYFGLPLLYFSLDTYRLDDVSDKNLIFRVFVYTGLTISLLLSGFMFARVLIAKQITNQTNKEIFDINHSQNKRLVFITLVCVVVLFMYLKKVGFENIALFSALGIIDSKASDLLRSSMSNAFEGKYHWYYLFMNRILIFCCFIFFVRRLISNSRFNSFMFVTVLLITILSLIAATEKAPLAFFIISLFFVYTIVKRKSNIPFKPLLYLGFFLIGILVVFYFIFMNAESFRGAFFSLFSRTLTGQIEPAYHYLEYFPRVHDFLYGKSLTNPMNIFPFKSFNIPQEVMAWYNESQVTTGIVGSMPTIFWGELYANFGVCGIYVFTPCLGFLLYLIDSFMSRMKSTPLSIALYVWVCMYLFNLNGTGISSYIFDIYITFILLTYLFLSTKFKVIKSNYSNI